MKVREVMNPEPVTCQVGDSVSQAARTLRENGISGMPVLQGDDLVGVVSESDLLRLLAQEEGEGQLWLPSPFEILEVPLRDLIHWERMKASLQEIPGKTVGEIMTRKYHSIDPDASIEEASSMMVKHRINRLPVVEDGRVVGIVTRGDIIRGIGRGSGEMLEQKEGSTGP